MPAKYCEGDDHNLGKWIVNTNLTEGRRGAWPRCNPQKGYPPPLGALEPLKHMYQGQCASLPEGYSGNGCPCGDFEDLYHWKPQFCSLPTWSGNAFCSVLGKRRLLFIGDSTMLQLFIRLNNALNATTRSCTCIRQLYFGMSGTLMGRALGRLNYGTHWVPLVEAIRPDVLVIGTGSHIFGSDVFRGAMQSFAHDLANFPDLPVLWKASPPFGCGKSILSHYPDEDFWSTHLRPLYGYPEALERDHFVRVLLGHRVKWFDFKPLWLRTDAHPGSWAFKGNWSASARPIPDSRNITDGFFFSGGIALGARGDCLHQCLNGPIHYQLRVLFSLIKEVR